MAGSGNLHVHCLSGARPGCNLRCDLPDFHPQVYFVDRQTRNPLGLDQDGHAKRRWIKVPDLKEIDDTPRNKYLRLHFKQSKAAALKLLQNQEDFERYLASAFDNTFTTMETSTRSVRDLSTCTLLRPNISTTPTGRSDRVSMAISRGYSRSNHHRSSVACVSFLGLFLETLYMGLSQQYLQGRRLNL